MTWVRVDDAFSEHPKVLAAGPYGLAVFVRSLCWASRNLTDGLIPAAVARSFLFDIPAEDATIARLVALRLWDEQSDGYVVHDYLVFNPSRAKVEADREARRATSEAGGKVRAAGAERGADGRLLPAVQPNGKPDGKGAASVTGGAVSTTRTSRKPAPVPVPIPVEEKKGNGASRFHAPSVDEVGKEIAEKNYTFDPEDFVAYYTARGWEFKRGSPMKSWKAACVTWQKREAAAGTATVIHKNQRDIEAENEANQIRRNREAEARQSREREQWNAR